MDNAQLYSSMSAKNFTDEWSGLDELGAGSDHQHNANLGHMIRPLPVLLYQHYAFSVISPPNLKAN
jgi:hypothetical protein